MLNLLNLVTKLEQDTYLLPVWTLNSDLVPLHVLHNWFFLVSSFKGHLPNTKLVLRCVVLIPVPFVKLTKLDRLTFKKDVRNTLDAKDWKI